MHKRRYEKLNQEYIRSETKYLELEKSILRLESKINRKKEELENLEQAQTIIQIVGKTTQEELQYHLSELVTLAMENVLDDPYKLITNFVIRRGKTEVDLLFERNGETVNPLNATGGGAVDIASLALQFSLWGMQTPRTRKTFILDEPLKWLKGNDLPVKGANLIKQISERLGVQIIMVSHSPELIESADNVIEISQNKKGISMVN